MFNSRKRKQATYRIAIMIARDELHRAQGEQAITLEEFNQDELLGCTIPSVYRASRNPVGGERIASGWDGELNGKGEGGVDLTGYVIDGKGF